MMYPQFDFSTSVITDTVPTYILPCTQVFATQTGHIDLLGFTNNTCCDRISLFSLCCGIGSKKSAVALDSG